MKPSVRLSSQTQHQKARLLNYLQEHGQISTVEARSQLDIMMPAARIFELRADGYEISTNLQDINTGLGCHRKVATYALLADR